MVTIVLFDIDHEFDIYSDSSFDIYSNSSFDIYPDPFRVRRKFRGIHTLHGSYAI